jgi:hypothetical protein
MFNLCRCNRLLCSLVNALGHMGLVAHLRKETELCVRVVDLYLFVCVCVCRSRGIYRSPQDLPGTCFGIPGATVMASAGGMWKAIAGGQNPHADIEAHAHTCPCIYYSKLIDTHCRNKNI